MNNQLIIRTAETNLAELKQALARIDQAGRRLKIYVRQDVAGTYGPSGVFITEGIQYRDLNSGFYIVPRVNSEQVTLSISPQRERLDPTGGGATDTQSAQSAAKNIRPHASSEFHLRHAARRFARCTSRVATA
ncbi:MAG: hypothetical protein ACREXT_19265 [Gammaproteobacteria bacterium]